MDLPKWNRQLTIKTAGALILALVLTQITLKVLFFTPDSTQLNPDIAYRTAYLTALTKYYVTYAAWRKDQLISSLFTIPSVVTTPNTPTGTQPQQKPTQEPPKFIPPTKPPSESGNPTPTLFYGPSPTGFHPSPTHIIPSNTPYHPIPTNTPIIPTNTPPSAQTMDDFARCLTNRSWKMYGTDSCSACQYQKSLFGSSFTYINYVKCDVQVTVCLNENIAGYPTWKSPGGQKYLGVQSLQTLSQLSGCSLP